MTEADAPQVLTDVVARELSTAGGADRAVVALLGRALELGDSREGAWPLLAADALLTRMCHEALSAENPVERFAELYRLCFEAP